MTVLVPASRDARMGRPRRYLMCAPEHFEVSYAINPWMDPTGVVDRDRALAQWGALRQTYLDLGHEVELIRPEPGLPDMVFAANGGLVVEGRALGARFAYAERQPEGPAYVAWLAAAGLKDTVEAVHVNEGEGDFLVVGGVILAGTGFRTDPGAHAEVQELFGLPVISLTLVDPRFYHREVLRRLFPDAVLASAEDAAVLGLNAVSDGRNVVLASAAVELTQALHDRGYTPISIDLSELLKAGGGAKCCTLEIRE